MFNEVIKRGFIVYPPYYLNFDKYNFVLGGEPVYTDKLIVENKNEFIPLINFLEPNIDVVNKLKKELNISKNDKIVTFTIRDYKFEKIRNTNYKFLIKLNNF